MSQLVDKLNHRGRALRAIIYRPILSVLARMRLTGNDITNFRFLLAVVFIYLSFVNEIAAGVLMLFILFLDTIDGALARYINKFSDRGKFLDIFIDMIVYDAMLLVFFQYPVLPWLLGFNMGFIPAVYLLAVIYKQEGRPTDWIINPMAQIAYLKFIAVAAYFWYLFIGDNYLNLALGISNVLIILHLLYFLATIERRWWGKSK